MGQIHCRSLERRPKGEFLGLLSPKGSRGTKEDHLNHKWAVQIDSFAGKKGHRGG